jgi:hypothetical protein
MKNRLRILPSHIYRRLAAVRLPARPAAPRRRRLAAATATSSTQRRYWTTCGLGLAVPGSNLEWEWAIGLLTYPCIWAFNTRQAKQPILFKSRLVFLLLPPEQRRGITFSASPRVPGHSAPPLPVCASIKLQLHHRPRRLIHDPQLAMTAVASRNESIPDKLPSTQQRTLGTRLSHN